MVSSPVSPADSLIRGTIQAYQATFNSGDREGWLGLFADDGRLEDPVGSPPHKGRQGLSGFWDEIHKGRSDGVAGKVRMVQGPAVCGLEAAWAFELQIPLGEQSVLVEIIDQAVFAEDGRIRSLRAFWNESTIRVE